MNATTATPTSIQTIRFTQIPTMLGSPSYLTARASRAVTLSAAVPPGTADTHGDNVRLDRCANFPAVANVEAVSPDLQPPGTVSKAELPVAASGSLEASSASVLASRVWGWLLERNCMRPPIRPGLTARHPLALAGRGRQLPLERVLRLGPRSRSVQRPVIVVVSDLRAGDAVERLASAAISVVSNEG